MLTASLFLFFPFYFSLLYRPFLFFNPYLYAKCVLLFSHFVFHASRNAACCRCYSRDLETRQSHPSLPNEFDNVCSDIKVHFFRRKLAPVTLEKARTCYKGPFILYLVISHAPAGRGECGTGKNPKSGEPGYSRTKREEPKSPSKVAF